ncbi:ISAs1 family transposase [Okeania hirsuta]|uniref:ISAs1 family transposase n=1 Tax=Okeania hirsuta TaxID=1458930 RepID=A0A3N6RYP1_9CYAN|nr:ISAs1 family transposase [Okeania hirsuta]RQH55329.1 ISAs1 family transposase [Okeania hirsuta]RQH57425.1 ISAs1 family transposase [Okeania hirsuta]
MVSITVSNYGYNERLFLLLCPRRFCSSSSPGLTPTTRAITFEFSLQKSTFRRMMTRIDFAQLAQVFNQWAKQQITIQEAEWLAVDGKSIRSTVSDCNSSYQNFVNVVSVFSNCQGVPVPVEQFHNQESSEIAVVQSILTSLNLKGVVFTCDALHGQKKQSS